MDSGTLGLNGLHEGCKIYKDPRHIEHICIYVCVYTETQNYTYIYKVHTFDSVFWFGIIEASVMVLASEVSGFELETGTSAVCLFVSTWRRRS